MIVASMTDSIKIVKLSHITLVKGGDADVADCTDNCGGLPDAD